jgi:hypothetical protein
MFKYECIGDDNGENVEPDDNDVIENIKCEEAFDINAKVIIVEEDTLSSEIIDVNDEDETFDNEKGNINNTFINPSQDKNITGEKVLKCETCDFTTTTRQSTIKDWCYSK